MPLWFVRIIMSWGQIRESDSEIIREQVLAAILGDKQRRKKWATNDRMLYVASTVTLKCV